MMMNITADIHANQHTNAVASRTRPRDGDASAKAPEEAASRWDTTDTVESAVIDKQSLIQNLKNDPNVKWQSVADKKMGYFGNVEENRLRHEASKRVRALVGQTDFIGMGGAKINLDGTYEVMADAGSEVLTDKLTEMLTKAFAEDEEFNNALDKLKSMHAEKAARKTDGDSVTPPEPDSYTAKWLEKERETNDLLDKAYSSWYPTPTPHPESDSIRRMEDWLLNGAPFPHDRLKINMGPIDPYTGCSENITLGYA